MMATEKEILDMNLNVFNGVEQDSGNGANSSHDNKKRYLRHTPAQIQKMESFFKDCPRPNKKQRTELGEELGLDALQVKFWFQNKRTQMKAKNEHQQNKHLRVENDKLRDENMKYKDALSSACCPSCGYMLVIGDVSFDDTLRMENARLREEIDRISEIAAKYIGKPIPKCLDDGGATIANGTSTNNRQNIE